MRAINWIKRHPAFAAGLIACALAGGGEGAWLGREFVEAQRAMKRYAQKRQERETMTRTSPAPTESSQRALEDALHVAEESLAEVRQTLAVDEDAEPAVPMDEYLAIARFVEEMRARAVALQVRLKPNERFGWASYANEGPEPESVALVRRQRQALEEIINALLRAKPAELVSVRRERLNGANTVRIESGTATDYFSPTMSPRVRAGGVTRTQAFQIEFTGRTPVLREFLNALLASWPAFSVRSVEAEPVSVAPTPPSEAPPYVVSGLSKFTVLIDLVELRPASGGAP